MLLYDTLERFEKKFGHLKKKGLRINGLKMIDPKRKKHVIDVSRPLIFDNRLIPKSFEGLDVKMIIHGDLPTEFKIDRTEISNQTILTITDFAEKAEIKDQSQLWEYQIKELFHRLGS